MPSRKDFRLIASLVAHVADLDIRQRLAEEHAEAFTKANLRFDRARFLKACKVAVTSAPDTPQASLGRPLGDPMLFVEGERHASRLLGV